jgi:23S rRNA pseudouridine1911/1915/1917 synthase
VGDKVYGPRKPEKTIAKGRLQSDQILRVLKSAKRQMLHAWRLGFTHPQTSEWMSFESPLPEDMAAIIQSIRDSEYQVSVIK